MKAPASSNSCLFCSGFLSNGGKATTMIVADFSIIPMGTGTSAAGYVSAVHDLLKEAGVKFVPGPLATSLEAENFEQIFDVVEKANKRLAGMGVQRMITTVRIDFRLDKEISIESKLQAVKKT